MSTYPQDAAIVSSKTHKVLFENDQVRVLEVMIQPGEKEPLHMHPYKSIMIISNPARIKYFNKDGNQVSETKAEGVTWTEPMELHSAENVDNKPFHGYRIEIKK